MNYFTDLFSPTTYEAFSSSNRVISGFSQRQKNTARRVNIGDKFICYLTKLSRWIGILEIESAFFIDNEPIFLENNDPYIVRFKVKPIVWLEKEKTIPIFEDYVWNTLSFTKNQIKGSHTWTGMVRNSLKPLQEIDGKFLEELLISQKTNGKIYPIDNNYYQKLIKHKVNTGRKIVQTTIPEEESREGDELIEGDNTRKSIRIQALLAQIGEKMNFKIWIPKNDRNSVMRLWDPKGESLLNDLPINYDITTNRTIEQIDILWVRGRSIARAFEIEHSTSIYSGILRMADLVSLQPNINMKLHIVAPSSRREKVFQEINRPVFSLLEHGPLSEICTFISYESIEELSSQRLLAHLSATVLDEYEELAD